MAKAKPETENTETTEKRAERGTSFDVQARNLFIEMTGEYNSLGDVSEATLARALDLMKNAPEQKDVSFNIKARNQFLAMMREFEGNNFISENTWNQAVELEKTAPEIKGVSLSPELQLANLDSKIADFYADETKARVIDGERFIKAAFQDKILKLESKRNKLAKAIEKGTTETEETN